MVQFARAERDRIFIRVLKVLWHRHRLRALLAEVVDEVVRFCMVRCEPGHEGIARGRANRLLTVSVLKNCRLRRKQVEIGRVHEGVIVEAKLRAEIIRYDVQNVAL